MFDYHGSPAIYLFRNIFPNDHSFSDFINKLKVNRGGSRDAANTWVGEQKSSCYSRNTTR